MTPQSHNHPHKHQLVFVFSHINIITMLVCVYVCVYRVLVGAVSICLGSTDRQVSVEYNVSQGIYQWLIVDDQKYLR